MAQESQPQFGQGAAGYGIYYAHTFADDTIENYMVGAIVPTLTNEDPPPSAKVDSSNAPAMP